MTRILIILFFFARLSSHAQDGKLILLSKDYNATYSSWILSLDKDLKVREFYSIPLDSMDFYLNKSDGIIMTGGEDVNPKLYGKPDYKSLCGAPDNFRDSIEKVMITYAMNEKVPMIGICRGQQIINVVNGGTLIPDIPSTYELSEINHKSKLDSAHIVFVKNNSWLSDVQKSRQFYVNSRHHQSVDKLAEGFFVSATSPDGVIESIELKNEDRHPFVVCVQWHPENLRNDISTTLGNLFLSHIQEGSE